MLSIFWDFVHANPGVSIGILIAVMIILAISIEFILYERIPCHIIENGRRRNSPVLRHRHKNTYKIHGLNGKWKDLTSDQIKLIEDKRRKYDIHGKHIHPEIHIK